MKILLTLNKTYRDQIDGGYWYVYLPLKQMGHKVYFYDTVNPVEKDFSKVIDNFKPDLIYCCFTGNRHITPYEPWEEIKKETESGRTKTFNWYCDDSWRFDEFSSVTCKYFNVCSTPDPTYIKRYREIGYNNIIAGIWHSNISLYNNIPFKDKDIDISFVGGITPSRETFFESCQLPVQTTSGVSQGEMLKFYSQSKIGLNLSTNDNDPLKRTQIKQRIFEIPAAQTLLFTQYHEGIEEYFKIDKEIVIFKTVEECREKAKFLLKNDNLVERLALAGYNRFLLEHESRIRLKHLLNKINNF